MSGIGRLVERALTPFDHEGNELVLRFRTWKHRWFPYRTAQFLGWDEENGLKLGAWVWHLPGAWRNRWPR